MKKILGDINYKPILVALFIAIGEIVIFPLCYQNYIFVFTLVGVLATLISLFVLVYRIRMDRRINVKYILSSVAIPFLVAMFLSLHAELKDDIKDCYKDYKEWLDK